MSNELVRTICSLTETAHTLVFFHKFDPFPFQSRYNDWNKLTPQ